MRSLTLKMFLAFAAVCLIEAVLVAVFVRESTQRAFDQLIREEAIDGFIEDATTYYQQTGSLEGIELYLRPEMNRARRGDRGRVPPNRVQPPRPRGQVPGQGSDRKPPLGPNQRPGRMPPQGPNGPPFGLADVEGVILKSNDVYGVGERVGAEVLAEGTPLIIDGEVLGTVLPPGRSLPLGPRETAYMQRSDIALLLATLVALSIALGFGVFFARTSMRPVRELTTATRAMAQGDLGQHVPVRTRDELGTLTEAFNQMSADLEEANALRRQMTADIAHDLRTPLTVLSGYLEALRDGDLPPSQERFDMLHAEAQHLSRLVADLRTLSLADAGELSLHLQAMVPRSLLERVQTVFAQQAEKMEIALTVQAEPSLSNIEIDPDRMVQVLTNLVGNALRYTPEGGTITLGAYEQDGTINLYVQDTGAGIPADTLPYIFDRFYRVDTTRHQKQGESGLGLAIARSIVEAHGGTIAVESVVGEGTKFTVALPVGG